MHGAEVLDAANVTRKDTTEHSGLQTVVWAQQINGVPVFESVFKANLSGTGEIISLSSTIMPSADSAAADFLAANPNAEATPPVSEEMAILLAAENIGEKIDQTLISRSESPNPKLPLKFYSAPGLGTVFTQKIWLPMGGAGMRLAWEVNVTSLDQGAFAVLLDAVNGDPLVRISRTTAAVTPQYRVWTGDSPTPKSPGFNRASEATTLPPVVPRQLVSVESLNSSASPSGWIPAGQSTTSGNNIAAYADRNGNNLADTGTPVSGTGTESRTFDFPIDLTQDPSTYTAGSVTQLFYWCNRLHDEFYGLGFTETSGSFQNSNFNRNGPTATDSGDQDRVNAEAQDSGGLTATASNRNNANFSTQADGISPRMQVYIATNATPNQDDDLDVQTVIH